MGRYNRHLERCEGYNTKGEDLLSLAPKGKTRINGLKPQGSSFKINIKENFPTVRTHWHWNRFTHAAVDSSSLEVFKHRLSGMLLHQAGEVPSNLFYDSTNLSEFREDIR